MTDVLHSTKLPPKYLELLHRAGIHDVEQVPKDEAKLIELGGGSIDIHNARDIISGVFGELPLSNGGINSTPLGKSVTDLLAKSKSVGQNIFTFCQPLDDLLKGGVSIGHITEFFGEPGVGKTQLCMQICLDVQINPDFGGVDGNAIYIDAEGSLNPLRMKEMSKHLKNHISMVCKRVNTDEGYKYSDSLTVDSLLQGVTCYRVYNHTQMAALVKNLTNIIINHEKQPGTKKVKVIVVDSIAAPFRGFKRDQLTNRTRILSSIVKDLQTVASKFQIAVVLINQVTTKILSGGDKADVVGALGETWKHLATHRVHLKFQGESRSASLVKSSSLPQGTISYRVCSKGIRNIKSGVKRGREDED